DLVAYLIQGHAEALQHAGGDALALAHETEQEMLGPNVMVVEAARLVHRQLDHLFGARSQADVARDGAVAAANDELDGAANLIEVDTQVRQNLRRHSLALADESQEEVLCPDVVMVEPL